MKFVDQVKLQVRSGAGGDGCLSFRREKFVEFGGPNGGDGGRGGDVILEATDTPSTLVGYRYRSHVKAGRGQHGMGRDRTGANGADVVLAVPAGTEVWNAEEEFLIADLARPGDRIVLARGGAGGFGNAHFKSSTDRAPRRTTPGEPGEEKWVVLRLKLLADAGVVGLPNAGKSTFLAAVTRARPKIADYPFTTLVPQLGVVGIDDREFVLADIPGLIEGASEGHGLGDRFLGHIERCGVLLHLIDGTRLDVAADWRTVQAELEAYGAGIVEKPEIVALNKVDLLDEATRGEKAAALAQETGTAVFPLSGATGEGTREVLAALLAHVEARRRQDKRAEDAKGGWSPLRAG